MRSNWSLLPPQALPPQGLPEASLPELSRRAHVFPSDARSDSQDWRLPFQEWASSVTGLLPKAEPHPKGSPISDHSLQVVPNGEPAGTDGPEGTDEPGETDGAGGDEPLWL